MGNFISYESDGDQLRICLKVQEDEQLYVFREWLQELNVFQKQVNSQQLEKQAFFFLQISIEQFLKIENSVLKQKSSGVILAYLEGKPEQKNNFSIKVSGSRNYSKEQDIEKKFSQVLGHPVSLISDQKINSLINSVEFFNGLNQDKYYNFKQMGSIVDLNGFNTADLSEKIKEKVKFSQVQYPFILIDISAGASFYRVDSQKEFKQISESVIGESTLNSVMKLKTQYKNLQQAIAEAFAKGQNNNCDMTVEDIYGSGTSDLGLPNDLLASSMGQVSKMGPVSKYEHHDIMKSMVISLAINVVNFAGLLAQLENIKSFAVLSSKIINPEFFYLLQSSAAFFANGSTFHFSEDSQYFSSLGNLIE